MTVRARAQVCVCVCVCESEIERERGASEREGAEWLARTRAHTRVRMCVALP